MYKIIAESKTLHKKFNTCVFSLDVKIKTKKASKIEETLDCILKYIHQQLDIDACSKVGLKINTETMHAPVCIEYRTFSRISGRLILDRMYRVIQSNKLVTLNKLNITATVFMPKKKNA